VRDGVEAWFEAGVTPIVVPSSTSGGQAKAAAELFDAFAGDRSRRPRLVTGASSGRRALTVDDLAPAMPLVTEDLLLFNAERSLQLRDVEQPSDAPRRPTQDQHPAICSQPPASVEECGEPTRVHEADIRQVDDEVLAGDVRPVRRQRLGERRRRAGIELATDTPAAGNRRHAQSVDKSGCRYHCSPLVVESRSHPLLDGTWTFSP
jgi:hypothetical protein